MSNVGDFVIHAANSLHTEEWFIGYFNDEDSALAFAVKHLPYRLQWCVGQRLSAKPTPPQDALHQLAEADYHKSRHRAF